MDAKLMFLWMRLKKKKRFLMQVNKFLLLHLLTLPRY
ncbi:hypothetical protein Goklo_020571 [Gossypium klotzschianum]|uniref:Uncharacterized protein n=1 Tax=Gossypium klotzschianum TaxID=34286 RepID=A0A7J8UT36_9ROSI|nr:hypothetical protein [Gossypium klotzschianum]